MTVRIFCPQCGESTVADAATCVNGHPLPNIAPAGGQATQTNALVKKSGINWISVALFVVGLLFFEFPPALVILWILAIVAYAKRWGK